MEFRKYFLAGIALAFIVHCAVPIQAQDEELRLESYTIDNGLSQNMVQAICEDRQGFMWFGTKDGLNRFDGHQFVVYRSEPGSKNTLSDNNILSVFEDKAGNLWVGTNSGGLNYFDRKRMKFCVLPEIALMENVGDAKGILKITQDVNGDIWVLNRHAIFRIRMTDKSKGFQLTGDDLKGQYTIDIFFSNYKRNEKPSKNLDILMASDGQIYIASNGVFKSRKSINDEYEPVFLPISKELAADITEDRSGIIWFGSGKGLFCYNPVENSIVEYADHKFIDPYYSHLIAGPDGRIWINEWDKAIKKKFTPSLVYFDPLTNSFNHIKNVEAQDVTCIYFAKRNLLWFGTAGMGVYRFNLSSEQFHWNPDGLRTAVEKHKLELVNFFFQNWAFVTVRQTGTKNIKLYNWLEDRYYPLSLAKDLLAGSSLPGFKIDMASARSAFVRSNGEIWAVDPNYKDLCLLDNNGKIIRTIHEDLLFQFRFFEDKNEQFYVGYNNGCIYKLNANEDGLDCYTNNLNSFILNGLWTYKVDENGVLWIGTTVGLVKSDPRDNSTILINKSGQFNHNVLSLLDDPQHPDQTLWAGTEGGGLLEIDKKTNRITQYLAKDGLPNNIVYAIMADKNGNLWLSTNNGLSRFNPVTKTYTNFNKSDGLQSNEFNRFYYGKFKDGTMMFGGIEGFNYFKPESITRDTVPPQLSFTGFKIFNNSIDFKSKESGITQPIEYTNTIELPWYKNMLTFEFSAFDFSAPDLVNYAWKLEGVDKNWDSSSKNRSATYANLAPGQYVFHLKASNRAGFWTKGAASINVTILPPWWRTWWAYGLYLISAIGILMLFFRFRLNQLRLRDALILEKQEAQRLQEIDEIKTRFFSNITHEFRTPLTLILGPIEQLLKTVKSKDEEAELNRINRNARQLLRLINQLLDLNKLESNNMKIEMYSSDIVNFTRDIVESFIPNAESKGVKLEFKPEIPSYNIECDTDKLQKILDNLVGNAVKFTREGDSIAVTLAKYMENGQDCIRIKVRDTGIGITEDSQKKIFDRFYQADGSRTRKDEGTGIGLALVKELIELLNGKISLVSKTGEGSEFTVDIPVTPLTNASESVPVNIQKPDKPIDHSWTGSLSIEPENESVIADDEKPLVLVVEDNSDMRSYIKNCLKDHYQVLEAGNGTDGLSQAFAHIPDMVISDIMMPEMDGYELTGILKHDERTSHVPILLLTAKTAMESRLKGLETQADGYLSKPFNTDELLLNIRNMIGLRRKLQERYSGNIKLLPAETEPHIEDKFILKLNGIVEQHLEEAEFGVEDLCIEAHMSRTQLHRKIKALTGNNTTYFIKKVRLEHAMVLLKKGELSVSEIAYSVGFNTPNYFSTCFHEYFGMMPSGVLLEE